MRAGLLRISHPVNQSQVSGVEDGSQEFKGWVKSGKAIACFDGFIVAEGGVGSGPDLLMAGAVEGERSGIIARAGGGVINTVNNICGNADGWATAGVRRVLNGNQRIQAIIGAAQEDEEELFPVEPDVAFGQGALYDEGDVGESRKRHSQTDLEGPIEKGAAGQDIEVMHKKKE